jgi:iron complex outermembrane receptor protein
MHHLNKPVAAICLAVASAFVQAQQATYEFNIPAQPASQVLDALAKQTGLQPFFAEGAVKGVQSPGVKGKLSLREALDKVLAGTGLTYQFTAEKAVAIKAAERTEKTMDAIVVSDTATRAEIPLDMPATVGSRLGLTLRETPASVEIITRETMRERGETTAVQALSNATGISAGQSSGGAAFSMRGFSGTALQLPQMYNGLRYPGFPVPPRDTFNYDRIEVVKGPSSVLNGMGAIMGAINYVTKPADGRKEKELLVSYDNWNTRTIGVGIGDKASEQLAYRFDVSYMGADKGSMGFADHTSYENYHVTGELALAATSNFKVTLSGEWFKDQGEGYWGAPLVNGAVPKSIRNNNYNVDDDRLVKDVSWYRLNLEWNLAEGVKLRNETYLNDEDRKWHNAETYTYNPTTGRVARTVFSNTHHTQRYYGNRTDLTVDGSIDGLRNRLLAGFDYSINKHQRDMNIPFGPGDTVSLENPVPGTWSSPTAQYAWRKSDISNPAIYLEDQLSLTERLRLVLAARHDRANVDATEISLGTSFSKQYSGNSYRVGALYDLARNVSIYGQWSKSVEAPAQIVTLAGSQAEFQLAGAKQLEIGIKADLPGKLGEVTASTYKIARTNLTTADPNNPGLTVQIGEQSSRGVELATVLRPATNWTIDANATVLDARYDVFNAKVGPNAVSYAGNLPADVPEKLANLNVTWRAAPAWRVGAGAKYVGRRALNDANTLYADAYSILNAWVGWKIGKGELFLRGRNLTDKMYISRSYGATQAFLGEPRAFELSYYERF